MTLKRRALYFTGPRQVSIAEETMAPPEPGELLVGTVGSAISAGTELLIYRGQAPTDLPADARLPALSGTLAFPLKYGYAGVGRVLEAGAGVDASLLGRFVFAFQPHQTRFTVPVDQAILLANGLSHEAALLLPNAETAVNLVHDGRPLAGEQVAVFGQGIVGLLTTALLARMPLASLVTLDRHARRRQASLDLGAHESLDPDQQESYSTLLEALQRGPTM